MYVIETDKCTLDRECVEACPVGAIIEVDGKLVVNEDCVDCSACEVVCETGAIHPVE